MSDIILCIISVCILSMSWYFNFSLKISLTLFGINFLGIIGLYIYHSIQPLIGITSAPPMVVGLIYTYKSMIVFVITVIIIVIKKYLEFKNNTYSSSV